MSGEDDQQLGPAPELPGGEGQGQGQTQMPSPEQLFELFRRIDEAFRGDDIEPLCAALGDPADFPNAELPERLEIGTVILHHAIYTSSIGFIGKLIAAGASINYENAEKIPALFAAILSERDDRLQIMEKLLSNGADLLQLGYNDWTPLHLAVNTRDEEAIACLVAHGADPYWRASEDDADTSAFDDALAMEFDEGVEAMLNGGQQS